MLSVLDAGSLSIQTSSFSSLPINSGRLNASNRSRSNASDAFASGLMRVRGVRRQRAFDRGFALSDHADWGALLDTIAATGAARVLVTHGWSDALARYLAETRGLETGTIRTQYEGEIGELREAAEATPDVVKPGSEEESPKEPRDAPPPSHLAPRIK